MVAGKKRMWRLFERREMCSVKRWRSCYGRNSGRWSCETLIWSFAFSFFFGAFLISLRSKLPASDVVCWLCLRSFFSFFSLCFSSSCTPLASSLALALSSFGSSSRCFSSLLSSDSHSLSFVLEVSSFFSSSSLLVVSALCCRASVFFSWPVFFSVSVELFCAIMHSSCFGLPLFLFLLLLSPWVLYGAVCHYWPLLLSAPFLFSIPAIHCFSASHVIYAVPSDRQHSSSLLLLSFLLPGCSFVSLFICSLCLSFSFSSCPASPFLSFCLSLLFFFPSLFLFLLLESPWSPSPSFPLLWSALWVSFFVSFPTSFIFSSLFGLSSSLFRPLPPLFFLFFYCVRLILFYFSSWVFFSCRFSNIVTKKGWFGTEREVMCRSRGGRDLRRSRSKKSSSLFVHCQPSIGSTCFFLWLPSLSPVVANSLAVIFVPLSCLWFFLRQHWLKIRISMILSCTQRNRERKGERQSKGRRGPSDPAAPWLAEVVRLKSIQERNEE